MGRRTLNHRYRLIFTATAVSLLLSGSLAFAKKAQPPSAPAISAPSSQGGSKSDSAPPAIGALEQKFFFKTFPDVELSKRVDKIERQLYGEPLEAPLEERLQRLDAIYQEQLAEDRKKQEEQTAMEARQQAAQKAAQCGATTGGARPGTDEYAIERARVSIQAAREQEIAGLLEDGVNLYRAKQGAQAQEKFEQALRLDPQNAQAYFNLGIIEESRGNYISALANYKQAAKEEPSNRDYNDAVSATEKKASNQERITGRKMELKALADDANAAWKRGEFMSALDLYQQLDAKEPNKALVKYNIGSIYLMLKDQHNALHYYKQAHKLAPTEPKYAQAYERLATEVERVEREQDRLNQQAAADFNQTNGESPPSKKQKTPKKPKHQAQQVQNSMPTSPFTPFVGAAPASMPARGRTAFGVNPALMNRFQATNQTPGGILPPQGSLNMASYGFAGRSANGGVVVTAVAANSRAAAAGLTVGDQVRTVDGVEVASSNDINQVLMQKKSLDHFPLVIFRNGNLGVINF